MQESLGGGCKRAGQAGQERRELQLPWPGARAELAASGEGKNGSAVVGHFHSDIPTAALRNMGCYPFPRNHSRTSGQVGHWFLYFFIHSFICSLEAL